MWYRVKRDKICRCWGLKDEKEGENEDKVERLGGDGHGQELMRLGGRWMDDTVREMRERLKSYYQHLGWEISRCHGICVCMVFSWYLH